ncbi:MAG: 5'/3'-nucleotidase SurE [Treponema sp.]|nr:5'/3'-nucleotidase SurE [Treponema sp.]
MNLLLTNDDGYGSEGLKILAEVLSEKNNVYIIAPDSNRSAVSHHITIFNNNVLKRVSERLCTFSGYPADCTFAGLSGAFPDVKFDAVIAGINYGPNLGTDIIYSGTCAAAREAVLRNVPGIALSIDPVDWKKAEKEGFKFKALAEFVADNLEKMIKLAKLDFPRAFVNVNAISADSYKGVKITNSLCVRVYEDSLKFEKEADNSYKTSLVSASNKTCGEESSDYFVCRDGYISLSLVYADPVVCNIDCNPF